MNNLLKEIKKETWLFSDKEIQQSIEYIRQNYGKYLANSTYSIISHLYESKKSLTDKELEYEIKEYLYANYNASKEFIDDQVEKNKSWFEDYCWLFTPDTDDKDEIFTKEDIDYYEAIEYIRSTMINIMKHYEFTNSINTDLIKIIKNRKTWIFSDEEISQGIIDITNDPIYNDIQKSDPNFIVLYCYKNKGSLTKEEYKSEILNYLYETSINSKEKINSVLKEFENEFYDDYNDAIKNKTTFYHAVQMRRNILMNFLTYKPVEKFDTDFDDLEDDDFDF